MDVLSKNIGTPSCYGRLITSPYEREVIKIQNYTIV